MRTLLAGLLLIFAMLPAGRAAADDAHEAAHLLELARSASPATDAGLRARIVAISAALRGRRYALDPLGEGPGGSVDPDPLLRFDAFDCVTYVETVLALARVTRLAELPAVLQSIRYRGEAAAYPERNHLPSVDWLPNAERRHLVAPATRALFPDVALAQIQVSVDRDHALQALVRKNHATLPPGAGGPSQATLEYLPSRALLRDRSLLARVPPATLVMVVAPGSRSLQRVGIAEAITHFGIAVREGAGPLLLRAATPVKPRGVRDVDFAGYVKRNPQVLGFIFLAPLPP